MKVYTIVTVLVVLAFLAASLMRGSSAFPMTKAHQDGAISEAQGDSEAIQESSTPSPSSDEDKDNKEADEWFAHPPTQTELGMASKMISPSVPMEATFQYKVTPLNGRITVTRNPHLHIAVKSTITYATCAVAVIVGVYLSYRAFRFYICTHKGSTRGPRNLLGRLLHCMQCTIQSSTDVAEITQTVRYTRLDPDPDNPERNEHVEEPFNSCQFDERNPI